MEILLVKPVETLGEPGDVVDVKNGYARNYLFPKGFAVEPTTNNIQAIKKVRDERMKELMEREEAAQAFAEKLEGSVFTFTRKTHDDNKLYSSVRPEEIADAIEEKFGEEIEKSRVHINPIEELGKHPININIYKDIMAEVIIEVVAEGAEAGAVEEPSAKAEGEAPAENA